MTSHHQIKEEENKPQIHQKTDLAENTVVAHVSAILMFSVKLGLPVKSSGNGIFRNLLVAVENDFLSFFNIFAKASKL